MSVSEIHKKSSFMALLFGEKVPKWKVNKSIQSNIIEMLFLLMVIPRKVNLSSTPQSGTWISRPAKVCTHIPRIGNVFPSASPQIFSCRATPTRMVTDGRLPSARPYPLGGWSVRTQNRREKANRRLLWIRSSSCKWLEVTDGNNGNNPFLLHVSVVEVKFQLVWVAEIVLQHHDEIVYLFTLRRVVQPDLLVFEQVAVVG